MIMVKDKNIQEAIRFEIQAYRPPASFQDLKKTHVSFSGSPRKHPFDHKKVILVVDPYSTNTFYYEFNRTDISFVEELPNLVNPENETIAMVRIWVKKRSVAIRSTPFLVEETGY
jgi:inorganic pyrophosphatase